MKRLYPRRVSNMNDLSGFTGGSARLNGIVVAAAIRLGYNTPLLCRTLPHQLTTTTQHQEPPHVAAKKPAKKPAKPAKKAAKPASKAKPATKPVKKPAAKKPAAKKPAPKKPAARKAVA